MKSTPMIHRSIRVLLLLVTAAMPLFFLPFTLEVLELNKHFLLYSVVLIAILLWLLDGAVKKKFVILRTPFDLTVGIFVLVVLVSGLLSVDRSTSFIGNYNNLQIGVVPLLFLVAYSFLITQTFRTEKQRFLLIAAASIAGSVAALWFVLQKWAILPFAGFGVTINNTISLSNSEFGLYMTLLLMGSIALLALKKSSTALDAAAGVIALVSLIAILTLGFKVVFIILAIGLGLLLAFMMTYMEMLRLPMITATFALVVVSVLFVFLGSPSVLKANLPVEISLGVNPSYSIAWQTITDGTKQFLLGSGPSTFVYDFSQYKPESLNLNPFAWKVRFAKPYATSVSFISEIGVLGTLSFVFLILITLGFIGNRWMKSVSHTDKERASASVQTALLLVLAPVWVTMFVSMFFFHLSTSTWLLFFMLLALISWLFVSRGEGAKRTIEISLKSSPQYVLATSFAVVLMFAGGIVFGVFAGRYYAAEIQYTKAVKTASSPAQQISMLSGAVQLNSKNERYRVALAQAFLNEARVISGQADGSGELVARMVANGVNQAKEATDLGPKNVNTWETLASMYQNASTFAPGVNQWITNSLQTASDLEPSNPVLRINLGRAKYLEGKKSEAKEEFLEAIRLKPNYLDAYMELALFYEAEGDLARSISELEKGLSYGRQDPNYLFGVGRLYFNRNEGDDWMKAEAYFTAAITLNPNHLNSLYSLGKLADKVGNKQAAVTHFLKVLEIQPDREDVRRRLKQLQIIEGTE